MIIFFYFYYIAIISQKAIKKKALSLATKESATHRNKKEHQVALTLA